MQKRLNYFKLFWLLCFGYFCFLMLQITLRYIPFNTDVAFLQIKQTEVTTVKGYIPLFYTHVYSAIFALLAGFTQFNNFILKKYKKLHRLAGYLYVFIVLFLAAPSGLFIGYYANGGLTAKVSFIILGALWFWYTLQAIRMAKRKEISGHQKMMWRSFALATSAITLRLWKVILVYFFHPAPMDVYQVIAWLGWVPNLLLVEWLIKNKKI